MDYQSPWLSFEKPSWPTLTENVSTDIVIVGGGISGVSTLYYLVNLTDKKVVLLEKNSIGSGATGNNAGIAVPHIERPVHDLVAEYGFEAAKKTYDEVDKGWSLLKDILKEIDAEEDALSFPTSVFGISTLDDLILSLESELLHRQMGRGIARFLVKDSEEIREKIPRRLWSCLEFKPHQEILERLSSFDKNYLAVAVRERVFGARLNSALFCYKMLNYLTTYFKDRFSIYEQTEIQHIDIHSSHVVLHSLQHQIQADQVILCTNGYKGFTLFDAEKNQEITKYFDALTQREGYLAAYPFPCSENYAIGLLPDHTSFKEVPYWYTTKAPLEARGAPYHMIGGPEYDYPSPIAENQIEQWAIDSKRLMKEFLQTTFHESVDDFPYFWHGTMGYTSNGLRWVGQDPDHPSLWYNQGCNGIGIVPAVAGGRKVALLMKGISFTPSLFDPQ